MSARERIVVAAEWLSALGIAGFLVFVHVDGWLHASALWRDEISTLHIATRPTFAELWSVMEWESSPLLWPMLLRGWVGLGFDDSAESLRALALAIGLAGIGSLFFALWRIAGTAPLFALALVAANPNVIRFGDTLRAYGLGLVLAILLVAAWFRLSEQVTRARVVVAALLSILAVQCLYHDAVVVFALGSACSAAWALRGRFREAAVPLGIGTLAALTLLPYLGPLGRAREWNIVFRFPVDLPWLVARIRDSVEIGGSGFPLAWVALALAALGVCALRLARPEQRPEAAFFALALALGVSVYAAFLVLVGYPTNPWYYLSLLGLVAVVCEGALARALARNFPFRAFRVGIAVFALGLAGPQVAELSTLRMTNVDRVAETIESRARPGDLILVAPWYIGIAFDHYYRGANPWLSVPDLPDHKLTRYDLVKALMTRPDAVAPIVARVTETLAAGGRVWLVGMLPLLEGNPAPPEAPIAPNSPLGWSELEYQQLWSREVGHALQAQANWLTQVAIDEPRPASPFESLSLYLFESAR